MLRTKKEWDIYSIKKGNVIKIERNGTEAYGNYIIIQDDAGNYVRYAHLESVSVEIGQKVNQG